MFDYKRLYASSFATRLRYVKYWYQLSEEQQEYVRDVYHTSNHHVYEINSKGEVINLRQLNPNDKEGL